MSSFLITGNFSNNIEDNRDYKKIFTIGIRNNQLFGYKIKNKIENVNGIDISTFSYNHNSNVNFVFDSLKKKWLLAIGHWFYTDNIFQGNELELLNEISNFKNLNNILSKLEGAFTIIIGDNNKKIELITDITGTFHCYFRSFKNSFAISNSSLLLASLDSINLDIIACQEFIYIGNLYENRTFYKEVQRFSPGSVYKNKENKFIVSNKYWDTSTLEPNTIDIKNASKSLCGALINSIEKTKILSDNLICDLTGGYDSRAIFASFLNAAVVPDTFVSGDNNSDVKISKKISDYFHSKNINLHEPSKLTNDLVNEALILTDGEYDVIEFCDILRAKKLIVSSGYNLNYCGSYGEVARAYWWELLLPHIGISSRLDNKKLAHLRYAVDKKIYSILHPDIEIDLVDHFSNIITRVNTKLTNFPNTFQMDNSYIFMRMRSWFGRISSSTNKIMTCITPFQFRSVLEILLKSHWKSRINNRLITTMVSSSQPTLANIPLEHGFPCIPLTFSNSIKFLPQVAYYSKRAFLKIKNKFIKSGDSHFHKGVKNHIHNLFSDEQFTNNINFNNIKSTSIFNNMQISNFINQLNEHYIIYNSQFNRLLTLELCLKKLSECTSSFRSHETGSK